MAVTRDDIETFEIARTKARSPAELDEINGFFSRLAAISPAEKNATRVILANKAARGENVRALTKSEKEFVSDLERDGGAGLHRLVRQKYEEMSTSGEVLKIIAHSQLYSAAVIRRYQSQYHPEDQAVNRVLLDLHETLGNALLDFIGDAEFTAQELRKAAKESVPTDGSGGDVYVLLKVENDVDANTTGKNIGKAFQKLEDMAKALSVAPLESFLGFGGRGSGDWFPAFAGIQTVSALIEHLNLPSTKLKEKKAVVAELTDMLAVLTYAKERLTCFHVEIDV